MSIVESPASTEALRALLADASASETPLRIVGSGTWLSAGRPVRATRHVSTRALASVVEYVPGDLVITVGAGTTLGELADITAPQGQWLALDPFASPDGLRNATIGATIATASYGPLALGFGRSRDLVLGLSFITGDGTPVRAGGRVVKNVAGFDLVRLTTGAWGTLGVVTEVSLRLHARPAVDETFAVLIELPSAPAARDAAMSSLLARVNSAPLLSVTSSLSALVVLTHDAPAALADAHDVPRASAIVLARAMGNRARVDAMRTALSALGDTLVVDPEVWHTVRTLDIGDTTLRSTDAPSRTGARWSALHQWLETQQPTRTHMIIDPLRGAIRTSFHSAPSLSSAWTLPERTTVERAPASVWPSIPSPVNDVLSQRIRERFDPAHRLNPGIWGEHTGSAL